ncbi:hypothetical protein PPRY_a0117 [Pseudoalteromonas prydzensis ACAM 620]|nr:hypothetical protein [Pseudoalteromonas prydzensis ACAM 620]
MLSEYLKQKLSAKVDIHISETLATFSSIKANFIDKSI